MGTPRTMGWDDRRDDDRRDDDRRRDDRRDDRFDRDLRRVENEYRGGGGGRNRDELRENESLRDGEELRSRNGRYRFAVQRDGNLVVYSGGEAVWASDTSGRVDRFTVQGDGNLVAYDGGRPVWASDTCGRRVSRLTMQDDGNLVAYDGGRPVWCTRTERGRSPAWGRGERC